MSSNRLVCLKTWSPAAGAVFEGGAQLVEVDGRLEVGSPALLSVLSLLLLSCHTHPDVRRPGVLAPLHLAFLPLVTQSP